MARKATMAVVAVLLVGVAAAGGFAATTLLDGESAVDQVPSGVDAVVYVDASITEDDVTRQLANAGAEEVPEGADAPENTSEALREFENETDLDPNDAREVVVYGRYPDAPDAEEYTGIVLHADWDNEVVLQNLREESDTEYEETTYNGQTVFRPAEPSLTGDDEWVGVLGDGQYVFGTEQAVKDAVDVAAGDADAFDGDLRAAYDDTRDGLVKFAARVPREEVPERGMSQVDVSQYRQVTVVTGAYYTESNAAGVEMRMVTNSTEDARDVADVTDGALSIASGAIENDTVQENVRAIEIEREDRTVVLSYEESVDSIAELLEYYRQREAAGA